MRRVGHALGIVAAVALLTSFAGAITVGPDFPICTAPGEQVAPAISRNVVVWLESHRMYEPDDYYGGDIYGYDLSSGQEFPICTARQDQLQVAISGNIVVWTDYRNKGISGALMYNSDIYGYDLASGQEFPICTDPASQELPAISGNIVVWAHTPYPHSSGTMSDIYGFDLATGTQFPVCTARWYQWDPAVSGNIVVWADNRNASSFEDNSNWDIYGYDLATGQEFPVCTESSLQYNPAVSGNIVVWGDWRNEPTTGTDIYGYDLSTGDEFPICAAPGNQYAPAISGHIVVWYDGRNGGGDIYGYDLITGQEFPVFTGGTADAPSFSDSTVVWQDMRNYPTSARDIYGCALQNTPAGSNVSVSSGDTTITFETVSSGGNTTVSVTGVPPGPEPSGFQFLGEYYDISTTATYSGLITIAIHYEDSDVPGGQEAWLMLLHYNAATGKWVDITTFIDTVSNIIYGQSTSLSFFGIAAAPRMDGFLPPINMDGSSVFKLKSTIPVKLRLLDALGNSVPDATIKLYMAKVSSNVAGNYEEAVSTNAPDAGNTFRYDSAAQQYIFNLGTRWLSTGTWRLKADYAGLMKLEVNVSLK